MRPICTTCNANRLVAINCYKNGKAYYRKTCDTCSRLGKKLKPTPPAWYRRGYRKKPACEVCGFEAALPDSQLLVFHINGDLRNTDNSNLKTVCLNCQQVLRKKKLPWKQAPVVPDF